MKYKYKNISDKTLSLPEVGEVKPQQIVESETEINNANFEKVEEGKTAKTEKVSENKK